MTKYITFFKGKVTKAEDKKKKLLKNEKRNQCQVII